MPETAHDADDRPIGVNVLTILYAIGAVAALVAGVGAVWRAVVAPVDAPDISDAAVRGYGILAALLTLVYAGISGTIAYGLWNRNRAAWGLALFLAVLGVLFGLVAILFGEWVWGMGLVLVEGVIAWYLLIPGVRDWFDVGDMEAVRRERAA